MVEDDSAATAAAVVVAAVSALLRRDSIALVERPIRSDYSVPVILARSLPTNKYNLRIEYVNTFITFHIKRVQI